MEAKQRKHYYIPFIPEAKIDYLYLFELMGQATYSPSTKAYDTISYQSVAKLAEKLSFSKSTLDRILTAEKYLPFLTVDKAQKQIKLHNSFMRGTEKRPFVCLTDVEVSFLRENDDNLLCKYLIYMKYYCGKTQNKDQDFTAKQFLTACGYSTNSQSQLDTVSNYNSLLETAGFISITKYRDSLGNIRNKYTYT